MTSPYPFAGAGYSSDRRGRLRVAAAAAVVSLAAMIVGIPGVDAGGASVLTPAPLPGPVAIVFPADSGVVDVTAPPYGARPNDGTDDSVAIQRALDDNPTNNKIIYFPAGVYDISDVNVTSGGRAAPLSLAGSLRRNIFQGAGQDLTVLRLMDSVPTSFDKAVVNFGPKPAQRFRNSMRDMTVSVGVGHPQAIGVQFNASNQGTIRNVLIRSDDPGHAGAIGLDMRYTDEVGPLLVNNVTVDGFDRGIWTRYPTASQTFDGVVLRNQRLFGWENSSSQAVFARNVTSTNNVPAIRNNDDANNAQAKFLLIDSELTGGPAAGTVPAIENQKAIYLRNVSTPGYGQVLRNRVAFGRGNGPITGQYVAEYWANGSGNNRSGAPFELFPSPDRMVGLTASNAPEPPLESDLTRWASPGRFATGKPGSGSGFPNDGADDTAAIQSAIDSGATTVYLPNGAWRIDGTVEIRNNAERVLGTESVLEMGPAGTIVVGSNAPGTVVIERLEGVGRVEHASAAVLILQDLLGVDYVPTTKAPGDLYLSDVAAGAMTVRNQRVWARQLNIEADTVATGAAAKLINDGATVSILGFKTEDPGTTIKTINGGRTEVLGAAHVAGANPSTGVSPPRFVTIDSALSAAIVTGGDFATAASETRAGTTRTATTLNSADVYTAYQ
jgi:Pectate lyase superfamily protein